MSIPDTIGSVPQPPDVVTRAELLDWVRRETEHIKTELYNAIYKMGELMLSRISEAGLSSAATRQELD